MDQTHYDKVKPTDSHRGTLRITLLNSFFLMHVDFCESHAYFICHCMYPLLNEEYILPADMPRWIFLPGKLRPSHDTPPAKPRKFMWISLSCNGGGNLSHVSSYGVIFPITAQTDTKPSRSTIEMKGKQNAWILCYNMKRFTGIKDPTFSTAASLISGPWSKLTRINSSQKLYRLSSQIILNCQQFWKSQPDSHMQKYRR